jgi:hypothetical protein
MTISALIKRLDASWVTGTNQGGLSSSLTIANTTYHIFAIRVAGVDDVGFDTSVTAANLIADHSATHIRRIGSIVRAGGVINPFVQNNDKFMLQTPVKDIDNATLTTASQTETLASIPTGIVVEAIITAFAYRTGGTIYVYVRALTQSDQAPTFGGYANLYDPSSGAGDEANLRIMTNTSSQIAARASAAASQFVIMTHGWVDMRGRLS